MRRAFVPLLALTLVAGACSGGDDSGSEKKSSTTPKETTTTLPPKVAAPLTGAMMERTEAGRPAVSVKVNNTKEGGVQAGIDQADVLFEERVEGGFTRFVAVFHSQDSDLVGPIRSIRPTDPALVWPFGGVFAFSDGAPHVVRQLNGVPVKAVYEMQGGAPFTYPRDRSRPYKTFAATSRLRQEAADAAAPPAFARFLPEGQEMAGGEPATAATVTFGPRTVSGVTWDPASFRWLKTTNGAPQKVTSGAQLSFATVIVQFVPYASAGYRDSAGSIVDKASLVGSGDGFVLANGKRKAIKWSKAEPGAMTKYTDAAGAPIELPAGPILVMLPAVGSAVNVTTPAPPPTTSG
jgi:hypothetical protein